MSWNYRIVRKNDQLEVYDVYYDEDGNPSSRHVKPTTLYGEDVEEISKQIDLIKECLRKPVIDDEIFGE